MTTQLASLFGEMPDHPAPLPRDEVTLLASLPLYGADQCVREVALDEEAACRRLEKRGLVKVHRWKDDPIAVRRTMYAGRLP